MLSTPLIALTSYEVLAGLASIYLGLIVCWGTYWLFYGVAQKRRESETLSFKSQIDRQQKEYAATQKELSATVDAFVVSKHQLHSLQLEMTDLSHRVDQLESAQFELEQSVNERRDEDQPVLTLFDTVVDSTTKIDPELGLIYTEKPDRGDDLTSIWGIGGVNQQKLQEHGVYFVDQIANWTIANCEAFNAILGFKGRIQREAWVSQAVRQTKASEEGTAEAA